VECLKIDPESLLFGLSSSFPLYLTSVLPRVLSPEGLKELHSTPGKGHLWIRYGHTTGAGTQADHTNIPSIYDTLLPLTAFVNLTVVNLSDHMYPGVCSFPELTSLVSQWPSLEVLRMPLIARCDSLLDLHTLGQTCRKLRVVEVPVVTSVEELQVVLAKVADLDAMERVTCLFLKAPEQVKDEKEEQEAIERAALVMRRLAPHLRHTNTPCGPNDVFWRSVMAQMGTGLLVEKQESMQDLTRKRTCDCCRLVPRRFRSSHQLTEYHVLYSTHIYNPPTSYCWDSGLIVTVSLRYECRRETQAFHSYPLAYRYIASASIEPCCILSRATSSLHCYAL